jgi:hypothetical protein
MPCCAFAAFILGQVLIGFDAFKRFVLRRSDTIGNLPINRVTEWRLEVGEASSRLAPAKSRSRLGIRWLAAAGSIEIALVAGGAYGIRTHWERHHPVSFGANVLICRNPSPPRTR